LQKSLLALPRLSLKSPHVAENWAHSKPVLGDLKGAIGRLLARCPTNLRQSPPIRPPIRPPNKGRRRLLQRTSVSIVLYSYQPSLDGWIKKSSITFQQSAHVFCGRTLPKSSWIDAVASGDTGNADLVTKRCRRVYKGREIPLGKTFPMWAAWGISGAAKPLRRMCAARAKLQALSSLCKGLLHLLANPKCWLPQSWAYGPFGWMGSWGRAVRCWMGKPGKLLCTV
jgi:hypothetical protein